MNLAKAKRQIGQWGLARYLYSGILGRLNPWLTLCSVWLRPLSQQEASLPPLAGQRSIGIASTRELVAASSDPVNELNGKLVRRAHERGEVCLAVFEGERILAYLWRAFDPTPHEKGLWVGCGPRCSYVFKAFTHPAYRRQWLQQHLSFEMDNWLLDRGYTHSLGYIETHNYPSLAAARYRGSRRVGFAGYVTVFGRVIPFRTPGAKRYGFAFFSHEPQAAARQTRTSQ